MNDLGRRYFLFSGTRRGKETIAGAAIAIAIVLDLIATTLIGSGHSSRAVGVLFSFAAGIMLVALILLVISRRAK
jgi:zinc transporter ZupT